MHDVKSLRLAFCAFLGADRYRKFIAQGFKPRLRYWQEQEWNNFVLANPEFAISLAELEAAFRICEIHGLELIPINAVLFHGNLDYAPDSPDRSNLYPHTADRPISTEGRPLDEVSTLVWYCSACRVTLEDLSRVRI